MAPTGRHNLTRRDLGSGGIFTVVFATVAFAVVGVCFLWACVLPWLRVKYINQRFRSQVRSTEGDHLHRRRRESVLAAFFPSEDPDQGALKKHTSIELRTYNPRSETPFPNQPQAGKTASVLRLTPKTYSAARMGSTSAINNFFTPSKNQTLVDCEISLAESSTVPKSRLENLYTKSVMSDKKFGDAKEYILALPEPLALTPRHADAVATPVRTLPKIHGFPPAPMSKHLHPKSLFQNLNKNNADTSRCSDMTKRTEEERGVSSVRTSDILQSDNCDSQYETEEESTEHNLASKKESDTISIADMSLPSTPDEDESDENHNPSLAAIHRLKTYRSLTGAKDPRSLTRSGTYTRSKTPVAEIRSIFDRTASEGRRQVKALAQGDIFTTQPFNRKESAGKAQSSSTNATSFDFSASSLSLLPTPLRIRAGSLDKDIPPVPTVTEGQAPLTALPVSREHAADVHNAFKTKRAIRKPASASALSTRSRPAPLELKKSHMPKYRMPLLREVSSASSLLAPLVLPTGSRDNFRGSSIYSRDTKGISIARTPLSSGYGSTSGQTPASPYFSSNATITSDKTSLTHRKPSSPADMVKTKVDNWHYQVGENLGLDPSPFSPFQYELDGPGPEIRNSHRASQVEETVSVISTEINPEEEACGRMSIPRINVGRSINEHPRQLGHHDSNHGSLTANHAVRQVTSDSALLFTGRSQAPGGAQWF